MMNTFSPTRHNYSHHLRNNTDWANTSFPEGICPLAPGENPSSEKGAGEPLLPTVIRNKQVLQGISESEVFLKQVFGNGYERVSKSFKRVVLPVIPIEYVLMNTEDDGKTEKILGKGGFGMVLEGTLLFPRGKMKSVVLKENFDRSDQESIADEARICTYLERTGFVPICYGLVKADSGALRMILECFGNGTTLRKVLKEGHIPKSHHVLLLDIACQLAEGLNRIHSMHILLNDLKSDNILVDLTHAKPYIRFCDFGLSSYKEGIRYVNVDRLSSPHIAPEHSGESNLPTTTANDVFGLGRMLKRIYTITKFKQLVPLVQSTYHYDPKRRCSANEALRYLQVALIDVIQLKQIEMKKHVAHKMDLAAAGEPAFGRATSDLLANKSDECLNDNPKLTKMGYVGNNRKNKTPNKAKISHLNNIETSLTPFADALERLSVSPQADVKSTSTADEPSSSKEGKTSWFAAQNSHFRNAHRKSPDDVKQEPVPSKVSLAKMAKIKIEIDRFAVGHLASARASKEPFTSFREMEDILYDVILHGLVLAFVTLLAFAWIKD